MPERTGRRVDKRDGSSDNFVKIVRRTVPLTLLDYFPMILT